MGRLRDDFQEYFSRKGIMMDAAQLARAQTEIECAHQALIDLGATKHFGEIERHWAAFIVHDEGIFHRLEAAAGGKGTLGTERSSSSGKAIPCSLFRSVPTAERELRPTTLVWLIQSNVLARSGTFRLARAAALRETLHRRWTCSLPKSARHAPRQSFERWTIPNPFLHLLWRKRAQKFP